MAARIRGDDLDFTYFPKGAALDKKKLVAGTNPVTALVIGRRGIPIPREKKNLQTYLWICRFIYVTYLVCLLGRAGLYDGNRAAEISTNSSGGFPD